MQFLETDHFNDRVTELLDDLALGKLQSVLMDAPDKGDVIPGGKGLRKIRWAATGKGKRGGVRIIYYWYTADDEILFADIYQKNEKENLSVKELARLKKEIGL